MNIDFDAIGNDLARFGSEGKTVFAALGRIHAAYLKLETSTRASLLADVETLTDQVKAISLALKALEQDDDMQKLGGAIQLARTLAQAGPIASRVETDLKTVMGDDWSVVRPDVLLLINTIKGTPT